MLSLSNDRASGRQYYTSQHRARKHTKIKHAKLRIKELRAGEQQIAGGGRTNKRSTYAGTTIKTPLIQTPGKEKFRRRDTGIKRAIKPRSTRTPWSCSKGTGSRSAANAHGTFEANGRVLRQTGLLRQSRVDVGGFRGILLHY
jgi:hypothetical protein